MWTSGLWEYFWTVYYLTSVISILWNGNSSRGKFLKDSFPSASFISSSQCLRNFLWGKEELKFLFQKRQRKDLNFSVPLASQGWTCQHFVRDLTRFHVCSSPGLKINWMEPYSREHAELETLCLHLEVLGLRVPVSLALSVSAPRHTSLTNELLFYRFSLENQAIREKLAPAGVDDGKVVSRASKHPNTCMNLAINPP